MSHVTLLSTGVGRVYLFTKVVFGVLAKTFAVVLCRFLIVLQP